MSIKPKYINHQDRIVVDENTRSNVNSIGTKSLASSINRLQDILDFNNKDLNNIKSFLNNHSPSRFVTKPGFGDPRASADTTRPYRSEAERKEAEARARAEELSLFIAEKSKEAMRVFDEASEEFENNGPSQRYKDLIDLYEELKKERDKAREEYKTLTEERSYPLPDDNDVPPIPLPEPLGTGEPGVPVPIGPIDPSPLDYDTSGEFSRRVRNKLKMREKPKYTNLDIGPDREERTKGGSLRELPHAVVPVPLDWVF